ncbi:cyclin-dependent kinase 18-like [Lolium rigidum]|uniref:cyclin-dependent kinase 18-like n=1 Tax=Lolium rigidum TaxID=89674 RepID=UPI001F5E32F9|nr:cyclin-dependent kinase 18-like [Lolium rigidum]
MEQLRQLGEAVGAINALMAFELELRINPRQCRLLADACAHALDAVTGEVRASLRFDERGTKWRAIEAPLRELHRALRDAEAYVRQCLDPRGSWWARAAAVAHGTDCVEHLLHNILWCVSVAVEAVETAGEIAGSDADDLARTRLVLTRKYDGDMLDPKLFQRAHGKRYLVSQELVARMDAAWKEDRWLLSQLLDEMTGPAAPKRLTRNEQRLAEVLAAPRGKLHPASILLGGDYSVRRRLGGRLKEVQWMGESFAVKHIIGDGEAVGAEVALLSSVAHPNVAHAAHCFHDEDRKEYFVVMDQLMAKDLGSYVKEVSCPRRRTPFPLVVAVDIMLQIARGMEYLHAKGICHGELNPSNVLVKPRQPDGGYVQVKVTEFGQSGAKASANGNANGDDNTCIWYAPEVLKPEGADAEARCTEKADVYSFAMICFELLTGKVPFEDNHLQGDKTSKNIRAGERPLFPFQTPKYLTALTKRCWHADPAQRPGFSSVCRVLRYVKRFLVMNPEQQQQADAPVVPPVDYLDLEMQLLRRLPAWQRGEGARVSDVPFQMFAYRVVEREKTTAVLHAKDKLASDSGSEGNSLYGDENGLGAMSPDHPSNGTVRPLPDSSDGKKPPASAKKADGKASNSKQPGSVQKVKPANTAKTPQAPRRTLGVKTDGLS